MQSVNDQDQVAANKRSRLGSEDVPPSEDVVSDRDRADSEVASEHDTSQRSMEESKSGRNQQQRGSGRSGRGAADENWQNSTWQYTVLVPLAE